MFFWQHVVVGGYPIPPKPSRTEALWRVYGFQIKTGLQYQQTFTEDVGLFTWR
jgi:hypothetical protein